MTARHLPLFAISGLALMVAAVHPAGAASPAPATPEVIAPGDLPSFQAVMRSDTGAKTAAADSPAPMPDVDASAPPSIGDGTPQVMPTLYTTKTQYRGDAFTYGSTAQNAEERTLTPAAGVRLNVPLD